MKHKKFQLWIVLIALNLMNFVQIVEAATIIPADSPLSNINTDVVRPNIMYVLDDSGSMAQDYTPDYLEDSIGTSSYAMCWGVDTGTPKTILDIDQAAACDSEDSLIVNIGISNDNTNTSGTSTFLTRTGNDIASATPALNYQHYNPAIHYQVPIKADGTSYGNMSATTARVNGFSSSTSGAINLTSGWKHKVWCNTNSPSPTPSAANIATHAQCKENANTAGNNLFPQFVGTSPYIYAKTYDAAPFYYEMTPFEYCSDAALTNCIVATSPSGSYTLPATNRWCASYNTLTNAYSGCQARRDQTHFIPKYLGYVNDKSFGTITVTDATSGKQITQITINGNNLLSSTFTANGTKSTTTQNLCDAIRTGSSSTIYEVRSNNTNWGSCSSASSGVIEIRRKTIDSVDNGQAIAVTGPTATPGAPASGTLTISITAGATKVDNIFINGTTSILTGTKPIYFPDGTNTTAIASTLAGRIGNGYTATSTGAAINITSNSVGVNTSAITLSATGVAAKATLVATAAVPSTTATLSGASIGTVSVNGTTIESGQNFAAGNTTTQVATKLAAPTGGFQNGFTGISSSATATITAPVGNTFNGSSIVVAAGGTAAVNATGSITITGTSPTATATIISDITVGGASILTAKPLNYPSNTTTTAIAIDVTSKIGNGYTATRTGTVINITAVTGGTAANGTLAVSAAGAVAASAATRATASITFSTATSGSPGAITIKAGSNNTCTAGPAVTLYSASPSLNTTTCTSVTNSDQRRARHLGNLVVTAAAGWDDSNTSCSGTMTYLAPAGAASTNWFLCSTVPGTVTDNIASPNSTTQFTGGANAVAAVNVQSTTVSGMTGGVAGIANYVTSLTIGGFPAATNPVAGSTTATTNAGYAAQGSVPGALSGGVNSHPGTIGTSTTVMNDGSTSTVPVRGAVGIFTRTDIVANGSANIYKAGVNVASGTMTYPKALGRTDCIATAGICTYAEELQNFANWYGYYKTRMLMMKSTSTVAFSGLTGGNFNVGFDNISNCYDVPNNKDKACSTSVVQPVGRFVDACTGTCSSTGTCSGGTGTCQRSKWWYQLTSNTPSSATPLRSETAKIGRYFAGKLTTDPIEYSCQQNFMFLVTDGYWNEADAYSSGNTNMKKIDGSDIGNTDNTALNASGSSNRPYYDGAMSLTACSALSSTSKRSSASSCRNLSDITYYYYTTDLRSATFSNTTNASTGANVAEDNVFTAGNDDFTSQHMTFFAMALGIDGALEYRSDYAEATSGEYFEIKDGTKNWPAVNNLEPSAIDDLWHAAVNGRGKYFSARDPSEVSDGLKEALTSITRRVGAASAAATSNLQPVAGDNFAYVASYTTVDWSGDLHARNIDLASGDVSDPVNTGSDECVDDSGCPWSAQKKLASKDWTTRKLYMPPASGSALRTFAYTNLTPTEKTYFNPALGITSYGTMPLSQYALLSPTYPTEITDSKMVDFLRGDRSLEKGNGSGGHEIWRKRAAVLGDIVNTQPTFVRQTVSTTYEDSGYSAFTAAQADREGVVYVSGNDGMLHAFASSDFDDGTASGGEELWAFIPSQALPYLRNLADMSYDHRYYVDGPITVSDVNFGGGTNDWHTILVAGMGNGGTEYFALDITDPVNPKFLWEFTHTNMGLTYSNPSINKLPNGEWAVLFGSGYNNADGIGYLYAVDVETGVLKTGYPLTTGSGTAASPSNLGKIAAWVDNLTINNTAKDVYVGDMDGNLWRFDLTSNTVSRLAYLTDGATPTPNPQPITTKPELTTLDGNRVVYVGTGRYLGEDDLTDAHIQSFYAIKDTEDSPSPDWNPRTDTGVIGGDSGKPMFVKRKLIALKNDGSIITRTNSSGASVEARRICTGTSSAIDSSSDDCINESGEVVDWAQHGGWYFDLPDARERINVDMNLTLGTLTIPSNVPASSACTSGGYGWVNYIDFKTGLQIDNTTMIVSEKVANALIVGLNVIKVGDKLVAIVTSSDFKHDVAEPPTTPSKFKGKRDMWRELDPY